MNIGRAGGLRRPGKHAALSPCGAPKAMFARRMQGPNLAIFVIGLLFAGLLGLGPVAAAATASDSVNQFHTSLIAALKSTNGKGFEARRAALKPVISQSFDTDFMVKVASGATWGGLTDSQKKDLAKAFQDMTVANYASRFKSYHGQTFVVLGSEPAPNGRTLVHTQLNRAKGDPVTIDYVMANGPKAGTWSIIDVRLKGSVSELALRRAEFAPVLRDKGPDALLALLKEKTAALATAPSDVDPEAGSH